LNVEGGLSVWGVRGIGTNDLVDLDLLTHLRVEVGAVLGVEGSIVLELGNSERGLRVDPEGLGERVELTEVLGDDVAGTDVVTLALGDRDGTLALRANVRGTPELRETSNKLDVLSELIGDVDGTNVTGLDLAGLNVLPVVHLGVEDILNNTDRGLGLDEVTAGSIDLSSTAGHEPLGNGGDNLVLRGNNVKNLRGRKPLTYTKHSAT
jgi:hypothetical protein